MSETVKIDRERLELWLAESHVEFEHCGQCEGLHLTALQSLDGAVDSRLFLEPYGLLLTTELEVRPMALFALASDLGRLNMDYPTLKVFLDIVDDATPQLVMAGVLPTDDGLTLRQFASFIATTMEATRRLSAECLQLDYLFPEGQGSRGEPSVALH